MSAHEPLPRCQQPGCEVGALMGGVLQTPFGYLSLCGKHLHAYVDSATQVDVDSEGEAMLQMVAPDWHLARV